MVHTGVFPVEVDALLAIRALRGTGWRFALIHIYTGAKGERLDRRQQQRQQHCKDHLTLSVSVNDAMSLTITLLLQERIPVGWILSPDSWGGSPYKDPPRQRPPNRDSPEGTWDYGQRVPKRNMGLGSQTGSIIIQRPNHWTEWPTHVKTLPCPKLCLRSVK